ncbi:MAG: hypothetical protein C5B50_00490 [Verrucomicrobia bacterium]|nr:MAG: hypothetical protein C5B50_00490 [Verrucomicrobiota bacterium]
MSGSSPVHATGFRWSAPDEGASTAAQLADEAVRHYDVGEGVADGLVRNGSGLMKETRTSPSAAMLAKEL